MPSYKTPGEHLLAVESEERTRSVLDALGLPDLDMSEGKLRWALAYAATGDPQEAARRSGMTGKDLGFAESAGDEAVGMVLKSLAARAAIDKTVLDAKEIAQYHARVVRGQEQDVSVGKEGEFTHKAPLKERTKSAIEAAKLLGLYTDQVKVTNEVRYVVEVPTKTLTTEAWVEKMGREKALLDAKHAESPVFQGLGDADPVLRDDQG